MINLLAPELKRDLRAAKQNVLLRRYLLFVCVIIAAMAGVFGVGFYLTDQETGKATHDLANLVSSIQKYDTVKSRATSYAKNLATAKAILGAQTVPSKFLLDLAATMPKDVILTGVTFSTTQSNTANGLTTLKGRSKTYGDALNLKSNLEKSDLFENVSLVSAIKADPNSTTPIVVMYPIEITVQLKITKLTGVSG